MELRIVDWNINGRRNTARQMALIDSLGWDVVLLQEARPKHFATFREHPGVGAADFSLLHRPDRKQKWCNGILVRDGLELLTSAPMVNVPSPERTLFTIVRSGTFVIEVASLALPPATSGWKELKAVQADAFGDQWAARDYPLIAGLDRNTPRIDHPELSKVVWFWEAEERLFGTDPKHDMRDVLRTYLNENPVEYSAVVSQRPNGPLATSFMRGKGKGDTQARYDAIYASPEFEVLDVRYPWDESMEAGSDHGAVWAHLRLRSETPPPQAGKTFVPMGESRRKQRHVADPERRRLPGDGRRSHRRPSVAAAFRPPPTSRFVRDVASCPPPEEARLQSGTRYDGHR